jgi:hypothetical protein
MKRERDVRPRFGCNSPAVAFLEKRVQIGAAQKKGGGGVGGFLDWVSRS